MWQLRINCFCINNTRINFTASCKSARKYVYTKVSKIQEQTLHVLTYFMKILRSKIILSHNIIIEYICSFIVQSSRIYLILWSLEIKQRVNNKTTILFIRWARSCYHSSFWKGQMHPTGCRWFHLFQLW